MVRFWKVAVNLWMCLRKLFNVTLKWVFFQSCELYKKVGAIVSDL